MYVGCVCIFITLNVIRSEFDTIVIIFKRESNMVKQNKNIEINK